MWHLGRGSAASAALRECLDMMDSGGFSSLPQDFGPCTGPWGQPRIPWVTMMSRLEGQHQGTRHCHTAEAAQPSGSFVPKWVSPAPGALSSFCYQYLMPSKAQCCLLHHSLSCLAPSGAALGVSRDKFLSRRSPGKIRGKRQGKNQPPPKGISLLLAVMPEDEGTQVSGQEL